MPTLSQALQWTRGDRQGLLGKEPDQGGVVLEGLHLRVEGQQRPELVEGLYCVHGTVSDLVGVFGQHLAS